MSRGKRNRDNERPGTRYGKRVVMGVETLIFNSVKYVGLRVRCDCGNIDVVRKAYIVGGRGNQCPACSAEARQK